MLVDVTVSITFCSQLLRQPCRPTRSTHRLRSWTGRSSTSGQRSARISHALAIHWDSRPLVLGSATLLNITLEVSLSGIDGEGWIGLGFGDSMVTAQLSMTMLPIGAPATVSDLFAFDGYSAPSPAVERSRVHSGVGRS